jgi:hypothetical protein
MSVTAFPLERRIPDWRAEAVARRQRLWNPPGGRVSHETEIVPPIQFDRMRREQRMWKTPTITLLVEPLCDADREELSPPLQPVENSGLLPYLPDLDDLPPIPVVMIARTVAAHYGLRLLDLKAEIRTARVVLPRHVAWYLCRTLTSRSWKFIGEHLGDKDHSSIMHGARKIEARIVDDADLAAVVDMLSQRITLAHAQAHAPAEQPVTG